MFFTDRKKLTAMEARVSELEADAMRKDSEITALSEELENSARDLAAAQVEIVEARHASGQIATEMLAAIGQPEPLQFDGEVVPHDHLAAMAKLSGVARSEYYAKHEAEIRTQLSK